MFIIGKVCADCRADDVMAIKRVQAELAGARQRIKSNLLHEGSRAVQSMDVSCAI